MSECSYLTLQLKNNHNKILLTRSLFDPISNVVVCQVVRNVVRRVLERGVVPGESAQSELQARRAGCIGERCHPAVVAKLTAVETDLL